VENIAPALLDWFYANRRILPFREDPTPYHVWLTEIMLQQTRVSAALPYYERFLAALPDIPALAGCEEEKLHKLWEGAGLLQPGAQSAEGANIVCTQYGGQLPADYNALLALPGIGEYTAGAIASISFGLPVPAVDGNVLRLGRRFLGQGEGGACGPGPAERAQRALLGPERNSWRLRTPCPVPSRSTKSCC